MVYFTEFTEFSVIYVLAVLKVCLKVVHLTNAKLKIMIYIYKLLQDITNIYIKILPIERKKHHIQFQTKHWHTFIQNQYQNKLF